MIVSIVLGFTFLYALYIWFTMKPKNFPPGPPYYPLIGPALSLPKELGHITLAGEWRQKYGPVVGLVFNRRMVIAVCGPREVLEVLKRDEFIGRPDGPFFEERSFGKKQGVFFSDGPLWVEQRRFTLRNLRDFGFGKKTMEGFIMDEVDDTIKEMKKEGVLQVAGLFGISTLNVLWGMIAGTRYSRDDVELQILLKKLNRTFRAGSSTGGFVNLFPILQKIAPKLSGHEETMNSLLDMQSFFRKSIREHAKTVDENNPRDLMDVYIKETNAQKNNPDATFTEEGLITVCLDMFTAGGETTTNSLGFSLLYMVRYPEIQKAVQKELDAVIGKDRKPSLDDRQNLNYVEAVLEELLRVCSIAPITPPRRVIKETTLAGYSIPKETTVILNLYSLFQDKDHWGDPEVFRPERFLNKDGKFVRDEWMVPFGFGRRSCIGELFARNTVFLFFTTLLQEFWFSVPEEDPEPSLVPLSGFTIAHQPFRVKVTKRI